MLWCYNISKVLGDGMLMHSQVLKMCVIVIVRLILVWCFQILFCVPDVSWDWRGRPGVCLFGFRFWEKSDSGWRCVRSWSILSETYRERCGIALPVESALTCARLVDDGSAMCRCRCSDEARKRRANCARGWVQIAQYASVWACRRWRVPIPVMCDMY